MRSLLTVAMPADYSDMEADDSGPNRGTGKSTDGPVG